MLISLAVQSQVHDTSANEEWGKSIRKTVVPIRKLTMSGYVTEIKVSSVHYLKSKKTNYYIVFEVPASSNSNRGVLTVGEMDEVIIFWKELGEYIKNTSLKDYTEYNYTTNDGTMTFGAYFDPGTKLWKLLFSLDQVGRQEATFFLKTENISEMYSTLIGAKGTIENMKSAEGK
jgi:hypothetical protein